MIATSLLLVSTLALTQGVVRVNDDPSQAPAICSAEGSDSILVAHEDCNKFYECYKGKPVAIGCQYPLLYNPELQWCDWPENVNCNRPVDKDKEEDKDNTSDNAEDNVKNANEVCAAEGSHGVLVPHEVCSKFYQCSYGKPIALDCPPPLLYNIEKEYCDWPGNVDCGNRS